MLYTTDKIRNLAVIAHVDHGKTTLVDKLLRYSGALKRGQDNSERIMDSSALEKEKGITILSKNTAVDYKGYHINIVDTPGHADFGGEVERALNMVDGALLLVDSVEGPMAQTSFTTRKAIALNLQIIVVINKLDRVGANPEDVINKTFDLLAKLGASDAQLDFAIVYASALLGWAKINIEDSEENGMSPIFDSIISHIPAPLDRIDESLQIQIASLDYSNYVGRLGIGRIRSGSVKPNENVLVYSGIDDLNPRKAKLGGVYGFSGLDKIKLDKAICGDIVHIEGIEKLSIGDTITSVTDPRPLESINVDEPTLKVQMIINTSPLAGKEGKYVTSRQLRDRLSKELLTNLALRVEDTELSEVFEVSGRGELHLSILIENMRREGFELSIGKPMVIKKIIDGVEKEPYESLNIDLEEEHQGSVMKVLGERYAELLNITATIAGRIRLDYKIATRNLIGFPIEMNNITRGTGIMGFEFCGYFDLSKGYYKRSRGVLISQDDGVSVAYALWKLQERGKLLIGSGEAVYEGMVIGIHSRDNDLVVNPVRTKKLTNVRADGKDDHISLIDVKYLSLEESLSFIDDDELIEITPSNIRIRKRILNEGERRRQGRSQTDLRNCF